MDFNCACVTQGAGCGWCVELQRGQKEKGKFIGTGVYTWQTLVIGVMTRVYSCVGCTCEVQCIGIGALVYEL